MTEEKAQAISTFFNSGAGITTTELSTLFYASIFVGLAIWAVVSITNILKSDEEEGLKIHQMLMLILLFLIIVVAVTSI